MSRIIMMMGDGSGDVEVVISRLDSILEKMRKEGRKEVKKWEWMGKNDREWMGEQRNVLGNKMIIICNKLDQ